MITARSTVAEAPAVQGQRRATVPVSKRRTPDAVSASTDAIAPHPLSLLRDDELAARVQAGSLPAFAELVRRFETRIYNFLLRRCPLAADAEDLTQDTLVRAWIKIGQYRPRHRFSTWLFTIASRLAIDHARLVKREQRQKQQMIEQRMIANHSGTAGEGELRADENLWDRAALVLSEEQHSAMWLRYAEDLSFAEMARVLGRTQIGVRVMLHRSRRLLAEALSTTGAEVKRDD